MASVVLYVNKHHWKQQSVDKAKWIFLKRWNLCYQHNYILWTFFLTEREKLSSKRWNSVLSLFGNTGKGITKDFWAPPSLISQAQQVVASKIVRKPGLEFLRKTMDDGRARKVSEETGSALIDCLNANCPSIILPNNWKGWFDLHKTFFNTLWKLPQLPERFWENLNNNVLKRYSFLHPCSHVYGHDQPQCCGWISPRIKLCASAVNKSCSPIYPLYTLHWMCKQKPAKRKKGHIFLQPSLPFVVQFFALLWIAFGSGKRIHPHKQLFVSCLCHLVGSTF